MRADAPLNDMERKWLEAEAPGFDVAGIPRELLANLYPDLLNYGPNYKKVLALNEALGRELSQVSVGNRKTDIPPGYLPIYDMFASWVKDGHSPDGMSFYDFDELLHRVMTSTKLLNNSGLIDLDDAPHILRKRLHDFYHDLALDTISDANAKVYSFDCPHTSFRYHASEVILVACWALVGPGIFPEGHPLEAQRIKWEKAIMELVPEVADA